MSDRVKVITIRSNGVDIRVLPSGKFIDQRPVFLFKPHDMEYRYWGVPTTPLMAEFCVGPSVQTAFLGHWHS